MQLLALVMFIGCAVASVLSAETYTSQFDNVDIDSILGNEKLVDNYTKCLLDEGPCTNEGRTLKKLLPDALNTACEKCTEKQKEGAKKILKVYQDKYPENFKKLQDKYDPTGQLREKFRAALFGSK